jgi:hypothetical protein
MRHAILIAILLTLCTLAGCASRSTGHIPSDIAIETANVERSVKALIVAVSAAESTLTQAQKTPAVVRALDQFYLSAYNVGARGTQIADALVAYEVAKDAASRGTIAARIQALVPLLQADLRTLVGIDLGPVSSADIVKLVQNVTDVVTAIRTAAGTTTPQVRFGVFVPRFA